MYDEVYTKCTKFTVEKVYKVYGGTTIVLDDGKVYACALVKNHVCALVKSTIAKFAMT